jgi:tRNA(Ile2) C34 agmatinyltransferase TiaS
MLDAGATPTDLDLNAADFEGILAIRRARSKFEKKYPECPNCGKPNKVGVFKCPGCGADVRARR